MKVTWIYYNDDDILIAGHLIKRFFRKPVFTLLKGNAGLTASILRVGIRW